MAQVEATTERVVAADAEKVFDALADYTGTRQKLLPEHFSEYEVREGGDGEGTLVHWNDIRETAGTRLMIERARTSWKVIPRNSGVSNVRVVTASAPNRPVSARLWSVSRARFSQRMVPPR